MDVFLLGAGRPARGQKPSALKEFSYGTRILDWQIQAFKAGANTEDICYLGGYHVEEIIKQYPQLNVSVIPDWEKGSSLETFLGAPFKNRDALVSYADTVFREQVISDMLKIDADIVYGVDHLWADRYEGRSADDIAAAEILELFEYGKVDKVEFTGLVFFKCNVLTEIAELSASGIGDSLLDLVSHLETKGFRTKSFDVSNRWAELNSPMDVAHFVMGTKAETLARLEPLVQFSHIGKQVSFDLASWRENKQQLLKSIRERFRGAPLVVRSSSKMEDGWKTSNAGGFKSLLNIDSSKKTIVGDAIDVVFASYGDDCGDGDQVLLQEHIKDVRAAGVVFTCGLETGAPYYRFNFDDKTSSTESVTAGTHTDLRTVILSRFATEYLDEVAPELIPVLRAIQELEHLLKYDKIDVEFAIDSDGIVHIFQLRPIAVDHSDFEIEPGVIRNSLEESARYFCKQQRSSPLLFGSRTILANMPDWNPAEIIGTRPKPLASSLYRYLITNEVWAIQRAEFGYRDVRPAPLILSLFGQPYVDSRASINSFIPATLPEPSAERLAESYLNLLAENPELHDKIEFDIVFTVWTPDFDNIAKKRLGRWGVNEQDIQLLGTALKKITREALSRLEEDKRPIFSLESRRYATISADLPKETKIHLLIEDCKRYGTLAFSHAARAGFIASTLLKSFVATGIMKDERRHAFLRSIDTVMGEFELDKQSHVEGKITKKDLVSKYGHLRPGTYEIMAQAYWEDPEKFFKLDTQSNRTLNSRTGFSFDESELGGMKEVLSEMGSDLSADQLVEYLRDAIIAREQVKFEFTRNISLALDLCSELAESIGLTRDEMSFLEWHDLERFRVCSVDLNVLNSTIKRRKSNHAITHLIELPPVIQRKEDIYCFERHAFTPNFVTLGKSQGEVTELAIGESKQLEGKIVLIPQADPGFDWLFGHNIVGLITKYGGANSHMAIRASEIGLPAAIGVGDKLYEQIASMSLVELDCANQTIREI